MLTHDHQTRLVVDRRFSGLPEVAHGGYLAGVLAGALDAPGAPGAPGAEVRLKQPATPGRELVLERVGGELVELHDGDTLVAEARPSEVSLDVPLPVTLAEAETAAARFPAARDHRFPRCFGCGTERAAGDGLRIFPGAVTGRRLVAAPWVPAAALADDSGRVPDELVWAALDCPQLWSLIVHAPAAAPELVVTAALATRLEHSVLAGEPHVVMAWPLGRDGRKYLAGAAVIGPDGRLCAAGLQTAAPAGWGVPLGWLTGAHQTKQPAGERRTT